jgi:F-type H+-transporting ATPase subunit b
MEATLHALGDLLIQSIPTILFFAFLTIYLKRVFFTPLARILDERKAATEGARHFADEAFKAADQRTSEFERALQMARAEIEHENEALRRKWTEEQAQAIARARAEADRHIQQAKQSISREVERAETELYSGIEQMSNKIVESVLRRRAA